jgi:hypothetical protein
MVPLSSRELDTPTIGTRGAIENDSAPEQLLGYERFSK